MYIPVIIPCRAGKGISCQTILMVVTVTAVLKNRVGGDVGTINNN